MLRRAGVSIVIGMAPVALSKISSCTGASIIDRNLLESRHKLDTQALGHCGEFRVQHHNARPYMTFGMCPFRNRVTVVLRGYVLRRNHILFLAIIIVFYAF